MTQDFEHMLRLFGAGALGYEIDKIENINIEKIRSLAIEQGIWHTVYAYMVKQYDMSAYQKEFLATVTSALQRREYTLGIIAGLEKIGIKWVKGSTIALILLLLPIIGAALAAYSTIRTGNSLESGVSFGDLLYTLFTSVADSDKVIKYGYILKDQVPSGHFYSLGSVIDYFKYGAISKMLFESDITVSQTVEYALQGNGYSYMLSYLYYPSKFLAGHGLGSCYIAELYQDMGYLGVLMGNIVLGIVIRNVFTLSKDSVLKNAVLFYMFKLLMLTPRNDYDVILRELGSVSFLGTLFVLVCVMNMFYKDRILVADHTSIDNGGKV